MVHFVVRGTGCWDGFFLVCRASKNGAEPLVVRTFDDEEDADDLRDILNEEIGDPTTESIPDDMESIFSNLFDIPERKQ